MPEHKQICIAKLPDEMAAEVAKTNLESAGIPAFISTDDCGGMVPFLRMFTKIRLMIDSAHESEARDILQALGIEAE